MHRRAFTGLLLALSLGRLLAAEAPDKWEKDIAAFEKADAAARPPDGCIVFTGSSSVRLWKTLAADFPDLPVVNRGFGGSQLADAIRYADRIVLPYKPRQVLVYGGTNDLKSGDRTVDQVVADFETFAAKIKAGAPDARIGFISIAPNPARWNLIEDFRTVNSRVQAICAAKGYDYIDVHSAMLGADGKPLPDIYVADQLHMNEKGYAIWKRVIGPHLRKS